MLVNVQFADETQDVVIGYYSAPQDPEFYPNMSEIDTSDARWKTFYGSMPEEMRSNLPAPSATP